MWPVLLHPYPGETEVQRQPDKPQSVTARYRYVHRPPLYVRA